MPQRSDEDQATLAEDEAEDDAFELELEDLDEDDDAALDDADEPELVPAYEQYLDLPGYGSEPKLDCVHATLVVNVF